MAKPADLHSVIERAMARADNDRDKAISLLIADTTNDSVNEAFRLLGIRQAVRTLYYA